MLQHKIIMKRIIIIVFIFSVCFSKAQSPKTYAEIDTRVDSQLPDNSSGAITPAIFRALLKDYFTESMGGREYQTTSTYKTGQAFVLYDGDIYVCKTDISSPESFTANKWRQLTYTDGYEDSLLIDNIIATYITTSDVYSNSVYVDGIYSNNLPFIIVVDPTTFSSDITYKGNSLAALSVTDSTEIKDTLAQHRIDINSLVATDSTYKTLTVTDSIMYKGVLLPVFTNADSINFVYYDIRITNDSTLTWDSLTIHRADINSLRLDSIANGTEGQTLRFDYSTLKWVATSDIRFGSTGDSIYIEREVYINEDLWADRVFSNNSIRSSMFDSNADPTTGEDNVLIGYQAGGNIADAKRSVIIGSGAGNTLGDGLENIFIGYYAGRLIEADAVNSGNVFIGTNVGSAITAANNELQIDNNDTINPLIHGYFDTDSIAINGDMSVNGIIINTDTTNLYKIGGGLYMQAETLAVTTTYRTIGGAFGSALNSKSRMMNLTVTDSSIVIPANGTGYYSINAGTSFEVDANGVILEIGLFVNDVEDTNLEIRRGIGAAGSNTAGNASFTDLFYYLEGGDVLKIKCKDDTGTTNATFRKGQFTLVRLN